MSRKVLFISSSLRKPSNSEKLAREVEKGVIANNYDTEFITLKDKDIRFCRGCLACQKTQKCVIDDDATVIVEKVREADVLVFATPIYYYEISGSLKTFLDRCNPLYPGEYRFREVFLVSTSEEDSLTVNARAIEALKGWVECFPLARFAGAFSGGGAGTNDLDSEDWKDLLNDAFLFGKEI